MAVSPRHRPAGATVVNRAQRTGAAVVVVVVTAAAMDKEEEEGTAWGVGVTRPGTGTTGTRGTLTDRTRNAAEEEEDTATTRYSSLGW